MVYLGELTSHLATQFRHAQKTPKEHSIVKLCQRQNGCIAVICDGKKGDHPDILGHIIEEHSAVLSSFLGDEHAVYKAYLHPSVKTTTADLLTDGENLLLFVKLWYEDDSSIMRIQDANLHTAAYNRPIVTQWLIHLRDAVQNIGSFKPGPLYTKFFT
jgi:hypothetical protein